MPTPAGVGHCDLVVDGVKLRGLGGDDFITANFGLNALKDVRFEGNDGNDSIDVNGLQSRSCGDSESISAA